MSIERLNLNSSQSSDILTNEHLLRYQLARQFSDNKIILDIACGSGYGSNLLAKQAKKVIGVDIDKASVLEAREKYRQDNLNFRVESALSLDIDTNNVDITVSLETIEHFNSSDQVKFLQELKRVLKDDGLLIMSTPNRLASKHKNPWHLQELNEKEFVNLLKQEFKYVDLLYQGTALASVISRKNSSDNDFLANMSSNTSPKYFIALASNLSLDKFRQDKNLELASVNGLAWQRKENNIAYRFIDTVYYHVTRFFKKLK